MNPIIANALVNERREDLLRQAEQHRRVSLGRESRSDRKPAAVAYRASIRPFVVLQGWLARGYL